MNMYYNARNQMVKNRKGGIFMGLVTTEEMFKKAYEGGYAVGAFTVNNMEIIQGIMEAAN